MYGQITVRSVRPEHVVACMDYNGMSDHEFFADTLSHSHGEDNIRYCLNMWYHSRQIPVEIKRRVVLEYPEALAWKGYL